MSAVFFLFFVHLSVGILATLPLVPERAGAKYFKFCSAAAAFMLTCGLWLALRRWGAHGGSGAPGEASYPALIGAVAAALVLTMLYNRARHFGWRALLVPLLAGSLLAGLASLPLGAPSASRWFVAASDLTSLLLLGAAAAAMILGHWYLVVLDLPIQALRRLIVLLIVAVALRALVVALALFGPMRAGFAQAGLVAAGLFSPDGVFVWMRVLFGLVGPASLLWFVWKTVEIRSTQSATGILYVQLLLVLSGELLAKHLRVTAGLPL